MFEDLVNKREDEYKEKFSIIVRSKGDPIRCYEGDKVQTDNGTILIIGDGEIIVEKQANRGFASGGHTGYLGSHTHTGGTYYNQEDK